MPFQIDEKCCFCTEFELRCGEPHGNRIVAETTTAVAVPSLGALTCGHTLLLPKRHYTSLSNCPRNVLADLEHLRQVTQQLLRNRFGTTIEFEHGVVDGNGGGCGIDHAHLHLVPLPMDVRLMDLMPADWIWTEVAGIHDLPSHIPGSPYIYVADSSSVPRFSRVSHVESQFMRKRIAHHLRLSNWDWRDVPANDAFEATLAFYKNCSVTLQTLDLTVATFTLAGGK